MDRLEYQPRGEAASPRTSCVGVLAAIGFAGLVCIVLVLLAMLFVTYLL